MMHPASSTPYVAIACGGTGGHLFPGLAVAEHLVRRGAAVALLVSPKDVDQQAVKAARGMEVVTLPAVALQRGRRLAFLRGFAQSWLAARRHFIQRKPAAVLAMGGFTSAPPVLVGRRMGARTFLHESNTVPGRANRWLVRFVDHAFIGFPQAAASLRARETTVTGTPVRGEFRPRDAGACRAALGFDPVRPLVLVMGGSQGATGINDLVIAALPRLAERFPKAQWLHLTGPHDDGKVRRAYAELKLRAEVRPFMQEMEQVMAAATAAISRAGASSLAELAALRLPAILVPFPHAADDHQLYNARAFAETSAALLLPQAPDAGGRLLPLLAELLENPVARDKMQAALARWNAPRAAEQIAEIILTVLAGHASLPAPGQGVRLDPRQIKLSALT